MKLRYRILTMMRVRGWSLNWPDRSAYLHLEVSELTEAVRGKSGDILDESADVLITLLALSKYDLEPIARRARIKVDLLLEQPFYEGEYAPMTKQDED